MFRFAILLAGFVPLFQEPQDWWNSEWTARRSLTLNNIGTDPLKAGVLHRVDIPATDLIKNSRPDFSDLRLIIQGRELPVWLEKIPGPTGKPSQETCRLWFRLPGDIPARTADSGFFLYYGNSEAPWARPPASDFFGWYEDFDDVRSWEKKLHIDKNLSVRHADRALVVTDVATSRWSVLALDSVPPLKHFLFTMDYSAQRSGADQILFQTRLLLEFEKKPSVDEALQKRIEACIADLSAPIFRKRQAATESLIQMGGAVEEQARRALATKNPEVKWRLEHVLEKVRDRTPQEQVQIDAVHLQRSTGLTMIAGQKSVTSSVQDEGGKIVMRFAVSRDPEGYVEISVNDQSLFHEAGMQASELKSIRLEFLKTSGLDQIRIDNLRLSPYLDAESSIHSALGAETLREKK